MSSSHDAVLRAIFDPTFAQAPLSAAAMQKAVSAVETFEAEQQLHQQQQSTMNEEQSKELRAIKLCEDAEVVLVKGKEDAAADPNGDLERINESAQGEAKKLREAAFTELSDVISMSSDYASAYNNRAQILRLLHRDDEALHDLNRAIELGCKNSVAKQAFCQRAMLKMLRGDENSAREDYTRAASLGSQFAKQELVRTNPYAAMCNVALKEVFSKLRGEGGESTQWSR